MVVLNGEIYNYRELRDELQAPRAHARDPGRHRGDRPPLRGVRRGLRPPAARHVRVRALGRAPPAAPARPRPGRQEAAALLRCATACSASPPRCGRCSPTTRSRASSTTRRSTPTSRSATCPAPLTALRGVRKLPPAHTLTCATAGSSCSGTGGSTTRTKLDGLPEEELCERIRAGLRAATRRRMIADVPLGAFLSGGIDSSAVVAAMAEQSAEPVRTFSIGFDHQDFDELPHARRDRRAVRHRAPGVPGPRRRGRDPAEDRPPLRRAVRRLLGDPELLPRRADPPARDRGAQRRRRRRVLRRLHALRRQRTRRAAAT